MLQIRRGRRKRRPKATKNPEFLKYCKKKRHRQYDYIRLEERQVDPQTPSGTVVYGQFGTERDQRYDAGDKTYGQQQVLHFKSQVP